MTEPNRNKGRLTLLLIVVVFLLPVVAAYLYMPSGESGNYGRLIQPPRPLQPFEATDAGGETAGLAIFRGSWTLLYVGGDRCLEQCRDRLFAIERVRLAQGKHMSRVQSIYLVSDAVPGSKVESSLVEYQGVRGFRISGQQLSAMLPGFDWRDGDASPDRIYIVDPLGNLMMSYDADAKPSGIKDDLKRLLKVSQIG